MFSVPSQALDIDGSDHTLGMPRAGRIRRLNPMSLRKGGRERGRDNKRGGADRRKERRGRAREEEEGEMGEEMMSQSDE
eukprot:6776324-Alexandrium_andersonii.AAC.1